MASGNRVALDLKICEACGRLYLRTQSESGIYCARCAAMLCDFPTPKSRKIRGRKSKHPRTYAHPNIAGAESQ
jgi:hypothetical protein